MEIEAKVTVYNRTCFRSMLEVRWAIFFDRLGLKWAYEPELCWCGGLQYLPDFWLPLYQSFVEIKPVVQFEGFEKCTALAKERPIVVLCGQPFARGLSAWVGVSGKLVRMPVCEFGICPLCKAPILAASYRGKYGGNQWVAILAPSSIEPTSTRCIHRFVHSPLEITKNDDESVAMAKLLLITAYSNARNARHLCGMV